MSTDGEVSIPDEWWAKPIRLAKQDSEPIKPEITAEYLADQAEIQRLSEIAEKIEGRTP